MRLTSLTVQHYKSLSNVQLEDIQPVTVLVGPNATGKSNVIDVLKFLRDMVSEGLEQAISKRGGITTIRQHSRTKSYQISFKLGFSDVDFVDNKPRTASYEITISSLVAGNYKIEREAAKWYKHEYEYDEQDGTSMLTGIEQHTMQRIANGEVTIDDEKLKQTLSSDQIVLGLPMLTQINGVAYPIADFVSSFRFSTIFPNTLREPKKPDADAALKETGENWASILKSLKRTPHGRKTLEHINDMMCVVMPAIQDIHVKAVGGYLVPQFRVIEAGGKPGDVYDLDPSQLSDGTLRVLCILLALYQNPAPQFVAIEEPEQTVHPGLLAMLAEAFHEVSGRTQLFVTSHSPHLIEFFAPEEIRVAAQKEGETRVTPIKSSQLQAIQEQLISMQELMMSEGLQPEEQ